MAMAKVKRGEQKVEEEEDERKKLSQSMMVKSRKYITENWARPSTFAQWALRQFGEMLTAAAAAKQHTHTQTHNLWQEDYIKK